MAVPMRRSTLAGCCMSTIARPPLYRVSVAQLAILTLIVVITVPFSADVAWSIWVGGIIHIVPHAWFGYMAFRNAGARQVRAILRDFYWGQAGKLMLIASMMILVIKVSKSTIYPVVLITFIGMVPLYIVLVERNVRGFVARN